MALLDTSHVGEHSPLPWSIHDAYEDTILDDAGVEVACCEGQCPATRVSALTDYANAELIVTAVNNYERLTSEIEALRARNAELIHVLEGAKRSINSEIVRDRVDAALQDVDKTKLSERDIDAVSGSADDQGLFAQFTPDAWRWRSIFNEDSWCVSIEEPIITNDQYIVEPLYAAPQPRDDAGDGTCIAPIEALRNCGCPSDRRGTVGECQDRGTCGCSLPSTRREEDFQC